MEPAIFRKRLVGLLVPVKRARCEARDRRCAFNRVSSSGVNSFGPLSERSSKDQSVSWVNEMTAWSGESGAEAAGAGCGSARPIAAIPGAGSSQVDLNVESLLPPTRIWIHSRKIA